MSKSIKLIYLWFFEGVSLIFFINDFMNFNHACPAPAQSAMALVYSSGS